MFLIYLLFSQILALAVLDDLSQPLIEGFSNWTYVLLKEDHSTRQPVQRPDEWTNLTFRIPYGAKIVQLIAVSQTDDIDVSERIPFYSVYEFGKLYVSVIWWGKKWKLGIGWLFR